MSFSKPSTNPLSPSSGGREFVVSGATLWEWWQAARQEAIAAAIPPTEVDWLLQDLTELDRLALRLESFKTLPAITLKLSLVELQRLWHRRIQARVPVQYLTGIAPWRQFYLNVSPAVLIPRPETECVIDLAMGAGGQGGRGAEGQRSRGEEEFIQSTNNQPPTTNHPTLVPTPRPSPHPTGTPKANTPHPSPHWADLGTGSGAIALGLATAFPQATIHAVDCSEAALAIAQSNAATYHLQQRIHFYQGSWFEPLASLQGQFSGIVSNPPYIPSADIPGLQPEVAQHEPHLALDGGNDGLDCIRHLIATAPLYLHSGGVLLFEMMAGQAEVVTALLQQQNSYHSIQIHPDLAGIDRFALAYRT